MKFTDLDATEARKETIRIDFDGFDIKIGSKLVSLEGQWVDVYPVDSKQFKETDLELKRKAIAGEKADHRKLLASLIADWSFDDECSEENKLQAIDIWPKVLLDHIDSVASKAVNFTKRVQKNSGATTKSKRG